MRDLQRLEELSSTAALGLWADDIVLALDRAIGGDVSEPDKKLLRAAADWLEEALQPTPHPPPSSMSARDLAATSTALSALATLAHEHVGNQDQLLADIAKLIREASEGVLGADDAARLQPVIALFELVGERQLVASNSVLMSRKDAEPWTGIQPTLSSS